MAIYCPMFDPKYGWYIIVHTLKGCYKRYVISPPFYYDAMGVKPPVGFEFTEQDHYEFESNLLEESFINSIPALALPPPISSLHPKPIYPPFNASLLTAPIFATSSQAAKKSVSDLDYLSNLKDPFLSSTAGSASAYSPMPSTASKLSNEEAPLLTKAVSLSKKVQAMDKLVFPSNYAGPSGSSIPYSSSSLIDSLAYPSAMKGTKSKSKSSLSLSPSMPHILAMPVSNSKYSNLALPLTSSNSSHLSPTSASSTSNYSNLGISSTSANSSHSYSLPSTSSGFSSVLPPTGTLCPHNATKTMANSNPASSPLHDVDLALEMFLDSIDESALENGDYEVSEL